ncbi:unnamed protein product [Symbiodinium sp. CCMP2456]|nr:unnamed protein product [Symbiodinium sp. CCMP2456]
MDGRGRWRQNVELPRALRSALSVSCGAHAPAAAGPGRRTASQGSAGCHGMKRMLGGSSALSNLSARA